MRQAVMTEPGRIEIRRVPEPGPPGPHEVLLAIKRIGVCGSDVHVWHGKHPFTGYPVVQGHEYSGTVEAVGPGVTRVQIGDRVTARPQVVCGRCPQCLRGDTHICEDLKVEGFQAPGTAQDLFVVPEDRVVRLPDALSFDQGAMVEPVAVAARATLRAGDLAGRNVVVLGAGPIGNLVAQCARARGARRVLITDLSDFRLARAVACGIEHTSNPASEDLAEASRRVFGEEGFDVAFEAAGVEATIEAAVRTIRKGGRIVVVGVFGRPPTVDLALVQDRELLLIGTLMYKHEDYAYAVEAIHRGVIATDPLFTNRFPFESYEDAYRYIDAEGDRSLKVLIDLDD